MSTKANNSKSEAVRVVMTPLGSAASNVFNMLNMSFFLVFSTEALGLNITAMGIIMTVMRIFDGITDPIIGSIIDRTETRFGNSRPFLVIGSLGHAVCKLYDLPVLIRYSTILSYGLGNSLVCNLDHWLHIYDNCKQMCPFYRYKKPEIPSTLRYCRRLLFYNA